MKRAKFWIDHCGDVVKLKLKPGETLSHSHGGPTEEGYSSFAATYHFDGHAVACEWTTDARDCDGRMQHHGAAHCALNRLGAGYNDTDSGVIFPAWEHDDSSQRDHSAEAAGY